MGKLSEVERIVNKQIKLEDVDIYLSKINDMLKLGLNCLPFIDYNGDGEVGLECKTNNGFLEAVDFSIIIKILDDLNITYKNLKPIDDVFWENSTIPILDIYIYNYFSQENKIHLYIDNDVIVAIHGEDKVVTEYTTAGVKI